MKTLSIASTGQTYQRLPGRAKRLFGFFVNDRQRLFLGGDHLLVSTTSYNYERYKRFYLADVQSLTIQKTAGGAVLNVVLGALACLFAVFALATYNGADAAPLYILGVIAGIFVAGMLVNTAFGPTCQCHILTAVHEEPLPCLGRLYTAQRVVEYLRGVIEGVQGSAAGMAAEGAGVAQRVERAVERRELASLQRADSGRLHMALFLFQLLAAMTGAAGLYFRTEVPAGVYMLPPFLSLALAVAAAIRQRDSDVPGAVRTAAWAAVATNCVVVFMYFYASIFEQDLWQGANAETEQVAGALRYGMSLVANGVNGLVNGICGGVGMFYVRIWRGAVAVQAEQQRITEEEGAQQ